MFQIFDWLESTALSFVLDSFPTIFKVVFLMKVIFGLGNPGRQYVGSRHNIGFTTVEYLADQWNISLSQTKFQSLYGSGMVNGEKVILAKPLTYMNLSGITVRELSDFYQLDTATDILVIYDDLDMDLGRVRLRQKGSAGGHNGIRSITQHLDGESFCRIKVGIGRPEFKSQVRDFVLTRFHEDEIPVMRDTVMKIKEICEFWLTNDFIKTMNAYNGK